MGNLRVVLGGAIIGLSGQVCASTLAEVPESTRGTAHVLALEDARTQYKKGIALRLQEKDKEAFELIKQAADAGWKWAQYTTASMCLGGVGTPIDIEEALDYYEMCCDEIGEAANQIGAIYGGVFPQAYEYENNEKALEYYKKAADLKLPAGEENYKRLRQTLGIK